MPGRTSARLVRQHGSSAESAKEAGGCLEKGVSQLGMAEDEESSGQAASAGLISRFLSQMVCFPCPRVRVLRAEASGLIGL